MKSLFRLFVFSLALASSTAATFTAGRVVVLQCVNNAAGGAGTLVEYDQAGMPGNQVVLPNSGSVDDGTSIVFGNSSTLNHDISLSADAAFIVIGGYANTATGVDSAAGVPRVVGLVKYDGTYTRPLSTTSFATAFRSATSDGFGNFWGMASSGGTRYLGLGTPASLQGTTGRAIAIANGNLYYTLAAGVYEFSGTPVNASPSSLIIPSSNMSGTATAGSFAIPPNPDVNSVAYLVDYNGTPTAGIGHFHWDGLAWIWDYNLVLTAGGKPQHIAVDYSGANPFVYFTLTAAVGNSLYAFDDTNSTAVQITVATAPAGNTFRGVVMAPTQPSLPSFTVHPANTTNNYGATAVFGPVSATGANPNAYTWQKGGTTLSDGPTGSGSSISGATTPTLTISPISAADAGTYYAVASNNGGSVTSNPAILALAGSSITTQLVSITNVAGTTAMFHVVSGGPAPLSYAWKQGATPLSDGPSPSGSGATISGSSTDTLTITGVQAADAGSYTVTVTDSSPADSSSTATLTVLDPPVITTQPVNQDKAVGTTANFSVTATGGSLFYQWFKGATPLANGPTGSGATISGAQSANLAIANVQLADAGNYSVTVTNLAGMTNSDPATLTVGLAPAIGAIADSTNLLGSDAVFSANVTGTAPLTYTWRHDGIILVNDGVHVFGADTASLGITNVDIPDRRLYSLTVNNAYGNATASALLFVVTAPPQPNSVPGQIIYEQFNYPVQPYPGFPAPAGWINSWENIISTYNQDTGRPAYWYRAGGPYCNIESNFLRDPGQSTSGQYPWPGLDCNSPNQWYWSSAPNNNHLKFGGVPQSEGAAYFSCILHVTQGSALNQGTFDTIAGFTSGDSVNGGANVDSWNYKLCTQADTEGGDGYYLGVFKGGGSTINASSVNGEWAFGKHLARGGIHFVVGCYKFGSGTNLVGGSITNDDTLALWIDPESSSFGVSEGSLPAPDAGGMVTNWNANASITEFGLRGTVPPASKRLTDLRIGKTWASVTPPYYPTLQIVSSPPNITLFWPSKDSGYILQGSPNVAPGSWSNFDPPYAVDGTNNTVMITDNSGIQFFRLIYPPR